MEIKVCDYCSKDLGKREGLRVRIAEVAKVPLFLDDDFINEKRLDFCNYECLESYCKTMIKQEREQETVVYF